MDENIWFNDQITEAMIKDEIEIDHKQHFSGNTWRHKSYPSNLRQVAIRRLNERCLLALFATSDRWRAKYSDNGSRVIIALGSDEKKADKGPDISSLPPAKS